MKFNEIFSNFIVEIPIIQREYAQGRKTAKVNSIRSRFVNDLVDAVLNNKEIHLGFIYGKIEGDENIKRKSLNKIAVNSILDAVKFYASNFELKINATISDEDNNSNGSGNIKKFIPLDGQQRLTTLYLLQWYLFFKGSESHNIEWLQHLRYTNRKSSMDFLNELSKIENIEYLREKKKQLSKTDINEIISNSNFFFKKWKKDQTVNGVLEMLSAFEKSFAKDVEFKFKNFKIENLPFKFDFMNLNSLNQTDELYVKMNSRGKQLTDYEHFKSWLQEKCKDRQNESNKFIFDNFWKKLDTAWLNYFWRNIDADFTSLDDLYYNFIKNLALIYTLANNINIPLDKFKDLYGLIRNTEIYESKKISYIPLQKYTIEIEEFDEPNNKFFLFNDETLSFISNTLDSLLYLEDSNNLENLKLNNVICKPFFDNSIQSFFIKSKQFTPNLWHSVFYYAFFNFLNERENEKYTIDSFNQWLRLTRNLIYNTYIQNLDNFNNALKQIQNLSNFKFEIAHAMLENKVDCSFFDNEQMKEEKLKLKLMKDLKWKDFIITFENHPYFYGRINFIIEFSKDSSGNFNVENFENYGNRVYELFHNSIRENSERIVERFLLCHGDYLPYFKSNNLFCNSALGGLRNRKENWRLFFESDKVNILKETLDKSNNLKISQEMINKYIISHLEKNSYKKSDWIYLFIKYPEAINFCNESSIRFFSDNDIRLLKGTKIFSNHAELRTYCFFIENKDPNSESTQRIASTKFFPFNKFRYFEDKNTDGKPGCYLEGFKVNNNEYKLEIRYSKISDEFDLIFFHKIPEKDIRTIDINLSEINFELDKEERCYKKTINYDVLESEIVDNLCFELKKYIK